MERGLLAAVLVLAAFPLAAQPPDVDWSAEFGGHSSECFFDVLEMDDGSFYALGSTESYAAGMDDLWLVKVSDQGELVWDRVYGGYHWDWGCSMLPMEDGGLMVLGGWYSNSTGFGDFWLMRTDAYGDTLWSRTYGGNGDDIPRTICDHPDGGYVMCGYTASYGAGAYDAWIVRVDDQGDLLDHWTYGDDHQNMAMDMVVLEDGSIVFLGETMVYGSDWDLWMVELDPQGNVTWETVFEFTGNDGARGLAAVPWGGFAAVGYQDVYTSSGYDVRLLRVDDSGSVMWDSTYGGEGSDKGFDICITEEGDFLIGGCGAASSGQYSDLYLLETDSTGNLQWELTFGSEYIEELQALELTADGGCIMAGCAYSETPGDVRALLVKTSALSTDPVDPPEGLDLAAYPNPLSSGAFLTIRLDMPVEGNVVLELHDLMGRRVDILETGMMEAGVHEIEWVADSPGGSLPAGVYCLLANVDGLRLKRNLVVF